MLNAFIVAVWYAAPRRLRHLATLLMPKARGIAPTGTAAAAHNAAIPRMPGVCLMSPWAHIGGKRASSSNRSRASKELTANER